MCRGPFVVNLSNHERIYTSLQGGGVGVALSTLVHKFANVFFLYPIRGLYATTLITEKDVIPAKAGMRENTGFRVKPGMTNYTGAIYRHV